MTVIGVVNKHSGIPALRGIMAAQPPKSAGAEAQAAETPAAVGGSATHDESVMAMPQSSTVEERILYSLSLDTHCGCWPNGISKGLP